MSVTDPHFSLSVDVQMDASPKAPTVGYVIPSLGVEKSRAQEQTLNLRHPCLQNVGRKCSFTKFPGIMAYDLKPHN